MHKARKINASPTKIALYQLGGYIKYDFQNTFFTSICLRAGHLRGVSYHIMRELFVEPCCCHMNSCTKELQTEGLNLNIDRVRRHNCLCDLKTKQKINVSLLIFRLTEWGLCY